MGEDRLNMRGRMVNRTFYHGHHWRADAFDTQWEKTYRVIMHLRGEAQICKSATSGSFPRPRQLLALPLLMALKVLIARGEDESVGGRDFKRLQATLHLNGLGAWRGSSAKSESGMVQPSATSRRQQLHLHK